MRYVILYIASLVFGGAGAWLVARWGRRFSLLDKSNHRSSHDGVVPKGGGIGILAAFFLVSWGLGLSALLWVPIGLISLFSLYGDRSEIPAKVRLCVQFLAGVVLLVGLFQWEGRGWPAYVLIPVFSVFIVGTANYYNFMDGINGIAGITGIVAFGLIVLFGALSGANEAFLILAGCMGFACLGFLPFNMPRARVFMGDVGSVLLGFVYAGLVVGLSHSLNDFVVMCSFLFPFYTDELTTEFVRIKDGGRIRRLRRLRGLKEKGEGRRTDPQITQITGIKRKGGRTEDEGLKCGMVGAMGILMTPHRRHVYQLLANEMGIDHWKVSVGYGVLQVVVGVGALMLRGVGTVAVLGYLGVWFVGFWVFGCWVRKRSADYADYMD